MWNLLGRVGSMFTRLPGAGSVPQVLRGAPATGAGRAWQGLLKAENASLGLSGLLYGSQKMQDMLGQAGFIPTQDDLRRMSQGAGKQGKNYTVGGIEYDFRSGRPINPPPSTFIPYQEDTSRAGQLLPSPPPALPGFGIVSNGAGVPAQRQNVLNRSLSQEVLNAAQQYAAPTNVPLSAFYEGQQQLGRSMMQKGNLVSELQRLGASPELTTENLTAWARQNPGLAYREFLRLKEKQ